MSEASTDFCNKEWENKPCTVEFLRPALETIRTTLYLIAYKHTLGRYHIYICCATSHPLIVDTLRYKPVSFIGNDGYLGEVNDISRSEIVGGGMVHVEFEYEPETVILDMHDASGAYAGCPPQRLHLPHARHDLHDKIIDQQHVSFDTHFGSDGMLAETMKLKTHPFWLQFREIWDKYSKRFEEEPRLLQEKQKQVVEYLEWIERFKNPAGK